MNLRPSTCRNIVVFIGMLASGAVYGQVASPKVPIPSVVQQAEALRVIRSIYGDQLKAAQTDEQKVALARELLDVAIKTSDDLAGKYMLLRVTRKSGVAAGDTQIAESAVEEMAKYFEIDLVESQQALYASLFKSISNKEGCAELTEAALALAQKCMKNNSIDQAVIASDLAVAAAQKARYVELIERVTSFQLKIGAIRSAYLTAKDAMAKLELKPTDPDANQVMGRYLCFAKGEWVEGVAMLALSNAPDLQQVAEQDLIAQQTVTDALKVGDSWWKLAEKNDDASKSPMQSRAVFWYRRALPTIDGLAKARVEKRISSTALVGAKQVKLDLLGRIDVERHIVSGKFVSGKWKRKANGITGAADDQISVIEVPFSPHRPYILEIDVTRISSYRNGFLIRLPAGKASFGIAIDALDNGKPISLITSMRQNARINGPVIERGELTTIRCEVLQDGITVDVNGKRLLVWKGDTNQLKMESFWGDRLKKPNSIHIGVAHKAAFLVSRIEFLNISKD